MEAIKVPTIMGLGPAYGIVLGINRYNTLLRLCGPSIEENQPNGTRTILGMHVIITIRYPDTFFAVTEHEYGDMLERLGGNPEEPTERKSNG